ncbi:MAG: hypothetical protein KC417_14065 [Myxococcales bacterium]|nr:hypothetical protein [Myxococcales bacterium]
MAMELAESCVRFVEKALGLRLDYTQDTLPILDHYLERARREKKTEVYGLIAPAAGAYFGEVVRRHIGDGRWYCPEDEYNAWRLEFSQCFLHFNPIGIVIEALEEEQDGTWNGHFQVLDADRELVRTAVAAYGDKVRAEDFYRLTVRLEILEQIYASLERSARGRAKPAQEFDHAIYDAVVSGRAPKTPLN